MNDSLDCDGNTTPAVVMSGMVSQGAKTIFGDIPNDLKWRKARADLLSDIKNISKNTKGDHDGVLTMVADILKWNKQSFQCDVDDTEDMDDWDDFRHCDVRSNMYKLEIAALYETEILLRKLIQNKIPIDSIQVNTEFDKEAISTINEPPYFWQSILSHRRKFIHIYKEILSFLRVLKEGVTLGNPEAMELCRETRNFSLDYIRKHAGESTANHFKELGKFIENNPEEKQNNLEKINSIISTYDIVLKYYESILGGKIETCNKHRAHIANIFKGTNDESLATNINLEFILKLIFSWKIPSKEYISAQTKCWNLGNSIEKLFLNFDGSDRNAILDNIGLITGKPSLKEAASKLATDIYTEKQKEENKDVYKEENSTKTQKSKISQSQIQRIMNDIRKYMVAQKEKLKVYSNGIHLCCQLFTFYKALGIDKNLIQHLDSIYIEHFPNIAKLLKNIKINDKIYIKNICHVIKSIELLMNDIYFGKNKNIDERKKNIVKLIRLFDDSLLNNLEEHIKNIQVTSNLPTIISNKVKYSDSEADNIYYQDFVKELMSSIDDIYKGVRYYECN